MANNDTSIIVLGPGVTEAAWEINAANAFFNSSNGSIAEAISLAHIWNIQPFAAKLIVGNAFLTHVPANAAALASANSTTVAAFGNSVFQRYAQSTYSYNDAVRLAKLWDLGSDSFGAKYLIGARLLAGQRIE